MANQCKRVPDLWRSGRISYVISLKSVQRVGRQSADCRPTGRWDRILYLYPKNGRPDEQNLATFDPIIASYFIFQSSYM